jgi:membrane-associated phospholipid phosphatase
MRPAAKIVVIYLSLITLLVLIFGSRIQYWWALLIGHACLAAFVISTSKLAPAGATSPDKTTNPARASSSNKNEDLRDLIAGWYPVVLIPVTYKELSYLIPLVHPRDYDDVLAAIDYRFLGVYATVWIERFTWPPLTEVLQLTYSTYYFLPIVLGVALWRSGRFEDFHFWVFIVALGFYVSYIGYIAVPAIGPRFLPAIVQAQTFPLTGVWLFGSVRELLDRAEGVTRDCFPSGHTELTLLVLIYARALHRRVFWWLLPLGVGIILSTVYLRYHYVIDVVAGVLVAIIVKMIAKPLYSALGGPARASSQA